MPQLSHRLGIGSLLICAVACAIILALILARQSKSYERFLPVSDWAGEYLWVVAPYVALAITSAVSWSSRFFSGWDLACVVFATVTNPAVYFLLYLVFGGRENESNTWTLFVGPVITWNELGAFLVVAVIVRVVQSVRQRSK